MSYSEAQPSVMTADLSGVRRKIVTFGDLQMKQDKQVNKMLWFLMFMWNGQGFTFSLKASHKLFSPQRSEKLCSINT